MSTVFQPAPRIAQFLPEPAPPAPPAGAAERPRVLNLNESPFGPSPAVVDAMQYALQHANRYPDHQGHALCALIAARSAIAADRVVVGAGSNELLFISADVCVDAGDEVIAPVPGFPSFARSTLMRSGTLVGVHCNSAGCVDVDAVLAAITSRTRLVFVSSPHNPTGGVLTRAEIERLVHGVPEQALLHFDEAYYEFGQHAGACETLPILERRRGAWISTRSFSKAYGLAGARIGYGLASTPELASAYRAARINFSASSVGMAGAMAAWNDSAALTALLSHNAARRDQLVAGLASLGYRALPGAANFSAFVTPVPAPALQAGLRDHGILVLAFPLPGTDGALRISMGTEQDMQAVIDAAHELAGAPGPA
ncbi:MAG: histidinol-phosphate transaminase [Ramlibacter sp.]